MEGAGQRAAPAARVERDAQAGALGMQEVFGHRLRPLAVGRLGAGVAGRRGTDMAEEPRRSAAEGPREAGKTVEDRPRAGRTELDRTLVGGHKMARREAPSTEGHRRAEVEGRLAALGMGLEHEQRQHTGHIRRGLRRGFRD